MTRYVYLTIIAIIAIVFLRMSHYRAQQVVIGPSPVGIFAGVSLNMAYATTTADREHGLSNRTSIANNYGMLFVFPKSDYYGFWMKDMLIPLDIFWLDDQGQVVSMALNVASSTYPNVLYPSAPARYVLETAAGFGTLHIVATGTPLELQNWPSISQ